MVRHSEDWWGVLRQGIESEHMGLVRHDVVVLGGARPALVLLGMEIELQNIGSVWTATASYCVLGRCWLGLDKVWKSN